MKPQEIFNELYNKLGGNFSSNGGAELLNQLIKDKNPKEAAVLIAELFIQRLDNAKPDDLEWLMREILLIKPELATIDLPYNPIFVTTVMHGVFELYRGYMDSGIEPFLKEKDLDEKLDIYSELCIAAEKISEDIFSRYQQYYRGIHYNSVFGNDPANPRLLWITPEDVSTYENIVKSYNSIIGRRYIIEDLEKRMYDE